jgi:hypothetical protein
LTERHVPRAALLAVSLAAALLSCRENERPGAAPAERAPAAQDAARREQREAQAQAEAPTASARAARQKRAAEKAATVRKVTGTVERGTPYRVTIHAPGEPSLGLRVAPRTHVTLDGRPTPPETLKRGTPVRAAYQTGGGTTATALSIEARTEGGPATPGAQRTPSSGRPGSPGGG